MPAPKIIAANTDNGIKMKMLVFRPTKNIHLMTINLSQF